MLAKADILCEALLPRFGKAQVSLLPSFFFSVFRGALSVGHADDSRLRTAYLCTLAARLERGNRLLLHSIYQKPCRHGLVDPK